MSLAAPRHSRYEFTAVEVSSKRRAALAFASTIPSVLRLGWAEPLVDPAILQMSQYVLVVLYAADLLLRSRRIITGREQRRIFDRVTRPELMLCLFALAIGWWSWWALAVAAGGIAMTHLMRLYMLLAQWGKVPPGLVFVGSFVLLSGLGTSLLMLPAATPVEHPINLVDATFTIISAISQTGLVVRPTGETFTRFGQVVILIWIQVGALGVIVFGALLANVLGSSFGLKATQTIAEGTEQGWAGQLSLQRLVTFIIVFTHLAELIGAAILYFGWPETWDGAPDMPVGWDRVYHCIFFSVSAFCNAGFSTTANSLQGLRTQWTPHLVIAPLIVLGSIGFPVLANLTETFWARVRGQRVRREGGGLVRLTVNTKLVLTTTLILYLAGALAIFLGELFVARPGAVGSVGEAVIDAHFMCVNRTAGFETVPTKELGLLGIIVLLPLMFIGGSPGSVAGGIKVMAVAVLALTVWATINGKRETTAFGRTLPDALVRKCAALTVLFLVTTLSVAGILGLSEGAGMVGGDGKFDALVFETVSAVGTCGLSLGITADLSPAGKIVISFAMFVGRVGPLAVFAALVSAARRSKARYSYPSEAVVVY